ncbi:hypothetical protein [Paludisphaera soli]|uniref:hypothetical protein n=1 Tax=Paludisphaera soli TaxID=2712865 RepID=UPI0013EB81C1|nr:hypothetical protein [Paludisphaera soli]
MPDPILMLGATAAALIAAALAAALGRWVARGRASGLVGTLAFAIGAYLGLAVLGVRPRWPLSEDQDRFLGLVLPGVLLVEAIGPVAKVPRWAGVGLRFAGSMAVAPTLLYGSSYLADLAGPGSALWPPAVRYPILVGLGLALFGVWAALEWTTRRSGSAVRVPLATAGAVAGAGLCVMLSGYASGGMNGLPLAGAIAGAAVARHALPGAGAVLLFGLLLAGYAFGELKPDVAAALFLTPLLAAVPEIGPLSRFRPWARTALALALVAAATGLAVGLTAVRFQAVAAGTGREAGGISADDYQQFP